ncbi:hypothetical protein M438DRAFT_354781 [Aureobasidium pullulans EXF-150]|uniref:DNA recombination and repair protein Rad51-like C-terminal domain-containing protein n=1 Tax=Aureobasidium pullulans EXF-150 TaxID=1043002 RepID=A0A074YD21_AURPU|nr:uncharacterized protein M438DRAFT_354781 [Aureobasidium pullulans EXF-150]KEQ84751.1 hypothetical protein M438DRAFT_354781 [Aureobasidium pullulans EXF-150]
MAVKPILASSLIAKEEIGLFEERARKRLRVGTGCAAVDDALDGGFVYGRDGIYNISGATGSQGAETISLQLLITHLLASTSHTATLIDATGNLDVLKLYRSIITRLSNSNHDHEANVTLATSTLDRVKIMRVFDFEGVVEGLNELIDDLEGRNVPKNTIGDSQEEAEDEMLDVGSEEKVEEEKKEQAGMVLINNLSQVLGLLLKNNYAQGQATLTTLVRRLRNTAKEHNLCIILLSWSVTYGSDQERVSIFESIKARPGLGKSLGYLVDTQLLIDAIPRTAKGKGAASDMVNVIEVIYSGGNHQAGKFGVFDITVDGEINPM